VNKLLLAIVLLVLPVFSHSDSMRDPTTPLRYSLAKNNDVSLNLQAIFMRGESLTAIVNGTVVRSGDKISGWNITKINRNEVVFSRGNKSISRTLWENVTQ
jgi:hypothetical protein